MKQRINLFQISFKSIKKIKIKLNNKIRLNSIQPSPTLRKQKDMQWNFVSKVKNEREEKNENPYNVFIERKQRKSSLSQSLLCPLLPHHYRTKRLYDSPCLTSLIFFCLSSISTFCFDQPLHMDSDPPLLETYKTLFTNSKTSSNNHDHRHVTVEERHLPLIDLTRLSLNEAEKERCQKEIARAARQWGFFQVVNHGISMELLEMLREEQVRVFKQPFHHKCREDKFLNFSAGSYRWGTPTSYFLSQLSWSEAFHIPMNDIRRYVLINLQFFYFLFFLTISLSLHLLTSFLFDKFGKTSSNQELKS